MAERFPELGRPPVLSSELGIFEVLGDGLRVVLRQPLVWVVGFALSFFICFTVQWLPQFFWVLAKSAFLLEGGGGFLAYASWDTLAVFLVSTILASTVSLYFLMGQFDAALTALRGERIELAHFFSGERRFFTGLGLTLQLLAIWLGIVGLAGTVLFFVLFALPLGAPSWEAFRDETLLNEAFFAFRVAPVIALLVIGTLSFPLFVVLRGAALAWFFVLDSDCSVSEALDESRLVTGDHRGSLLQFLVAAGFVLSFALFFFYVGVFFVAPVCLVAFASVYVRLTGNTTPP